MKHFVKCFPSKLIAGLVLSASMALTTSVSANEAGNWYIQGSAGLTTLENVEADRTTSAGATSTTVPFEADFKHGHMASFISAMDAEAVSQSNFQSALKAIRPQITDEMITFYENYARTRSGL